VATSLSEPVAQLFAERQFDASEGDTPAVLWIVKVRRQRVSSGGRVLGQAGLD
jgi:hypothetical protein